MLCRGSKGFFSGVIVLSAALAGITSVASADLVNPLVPAWHGSEWSEYYAWNSFTSAFGGPNLPDAPGTEAGAALFNFGAGAMITGAGNMQASDAPLSVSVYAGSVATVNRVIVNVASLGGELGANGLQLILSNNGGGGMTLAPSESVLRFSEPLQTGGLAQTRAFIWNVPVSSAPLPRFELRIMSPANFALDAVSIDVRYVPAPGAIALIALAGAVGSGWRRRRH